MYPRDGKNQHAFCIDIDRRGDVRVLANLVTTHDSADTMLHELGHGVYDLGFRDDLPWLLRSTHLVATEASAILFGSLAGRREWLERVLGLSAREGAELEPQTPRRPSRRAPRLHPLGARDERVRARAVRRIPTEISTRSGGSSSRATSESRRRTIAGRPTGPRRSTSRSRPSTTTRICTERSSRCSSTRRSSPRWAASSIAPRPAHCCGSGSSDRGSRSAGTASSSRPRARRCRSSRSSAQSQP